MMLSVLLINKDIIDEFLSGDSAQPSARNGACEPLQIAFHIHILMR